MQTHLFSHVFFFFYRYVTIEPDERKLLNATNVLGLTVDTILREGFRLISTRTVSPEEKIECYTFERRGTRNILIVNDPHKVDGSPVSKQTEKSTKKGKAQKWSNQPLPCKWGKSPTKKTKNKLSVREPEAIWGFPEDGDAVLFRAWCICNKNLF